MWLGELNPRVTGASSITNVTAVAYGDMPLFLFHLLEFMDVDYEIDVDELNERWAQSHNLDEWTQFILKQTEDVTELITQAPSSGIWKAHGDGAIAYARRDTDWHTVADETEAFYLRIAGVGQYRYPGADLGIMVTRGRFMDDEHELLDRARGWITGIKGQFASVPPGDGAPPIATAGALRLQDALSATAAGVRPRPWEHLRQPCRCSRSRSAPRRSSTSGRRGRPSSRRSGRTTRRGSCARARPRARRSPRACGCCARTCPSWCPAYEHVVELAGGGDLAARMLSLYKPPPYLAACSQGVWTREGGPMLVRNYDYAPSRFEGIVWHDAAARASA